MAVLIQGDPVGEIDVTKLLELGNGRAVHVSDELLSVIESVRRLAPGEDEATLLSTLVIMFTRLIEVCDNGEEPMVLFDQAFADRIVIAAHVGTVAIDAAQGVLEIVESVRQEETRVKTEQSLKE